MAPDGRRWDHPRIRGEHQAVLLAGEDRPGSSPHTRGAPSRSPRWSTLGRIIPAYAGSTSSAPPPQTRRPDHPRIRGEHPTSRATTTATPGIIPAYAGSTAAAAWASDPVADHPRIRGEHPRRGAGPHRGAGSSPHTRGAPALASKSRQTPRIIPAYAGSTRPRRLPGPGDRDHPRIRGEHPPRSACRCSRPGSSPHTRGALEPRPARPSRRRISPAYAGSTPPQELESHPLGDHPRIRGEHCESYGRERTGAGSSPHTRGARWRRSRGGGVRRIIPAYAGSTCGSSGSCSRTGDHPRIRGEHSSSDPNLSAHLGSSPHTRGARSRPRAGRLRRRIIPAYAGSTCHAAGV